MKKILFPFLFLLATTALWAQAPQRISYQSIIRDANKVVVASSPVGIKISLLQGTATGPAVYVETHRSTTNANGLVSLEIGTGTVLSGTFAGIDWSNGPYLIQTETDPTGGTNYSIPGIAALNSVPYALNAANAGIANSLAGTLAIPNGGTGATTATAAKASLGLENVDNTSDANKPVSTAAQTALSNKVDKVTGKELSTNDYTTTEKAKLAAITGTNTGDQDLSAFATTAVVALKANSADVTNDLATKVDKVTGKDLSTNDYTTAEKTKLAAITGTNTGDQVNITGNAATATKLQSSVTINGIAFDGSANITLPAAAAGIPYTGATQAVDLGAYDLTVNGITAGMGSGNLGFNTVFGRGALSSTALTNGGNYNLATGYVALQSNTTGSFNTATGTYSLLKNTTGINNTGYGVSSLFNNTVGNNNTAIGYEADVVSNNLSNATAIGAGAKVAADNTIQLGNTSVSNVKTSGTVTAGAVTYPRTDGTNGQVLTTNGSGTLSWAPGLPTSVNTGDMLYWNGSAWVKVAAGSNGQTLTFYNGAPLWITNANTVVNSTTGKIWMDRNLGARQVASTSTDADSYGDLYQWGRGTDGHQIRTSATTSTLSSSNVPVNGSFILVSNLYGSNATGDWLSPQNNNLWQGVSGTNNPCPAGFRIPTNPEWIAETNSWSSQNPAGAFASPLKLPVAGARNNGGTFNNVGTAGNYWSSTINSTSSLYMWFETGGFRSSDPLFRVWGISVRCIKD